MKKPEIDQTLVNLAQCTAAVTSRQYQFGRHFKFRFTDELDFVTMALFSQCEEAFLLKNVQNVIDVWARGIGQARLNFSVRKG